MRAIDRVRNTRLAHIQQMVPEGNLPGIAAFEELLSFAFGFHSFINEAFLNVHPHPTLTDRQVEAGLLSTLKAIGVTDPRHSSRTSNFAMNLTTASLRSALAGYRGR